MSKILKCFYDLRVSPCSYDIISFLAQAETCRIRRGHNSIHFFLIRGSRKNDLGRRLENENFLQNVIFPSLSILPSIREFYYVDPEQITLEPEEYFNVFPRGYKLDYPINGYTGEGLVASYFRNDVCGKLSSPSWAVQYAKQFINSLPNNNIITISAREVRRDDVNGTRYFNRPFWVNNINALREIGIEPILIRDTCNAFKRKPLINSLFECPEAALNVPFRLALYEIATHNFARNNGPSMLFHFSDSVSTTFLSFDNRVPSLSEIFFKKKFGMTKNSPFPFSRKGSNFVWGSENITKIIELFEQKNEKDLEELNYFLSPSNLEAATRVAADFLIHCVSRTPVLPEDISLATGIIQKCRQFKTKIDLDEYLKAHEGNGIPKGITEQIFDQMDERSLFSRAV